MSVQDENSGSGKEREGVAHGERFTGPGASQYDTAAMGSAGEEIELDLLFKELPPEPEGRYEYITEFAQGGNSRVYLVRDLSLKREIALKEMRSRCLDGDDATISSDSSCRFEGDHIARFIREAYLTSQLEHPSVVPIHEMGRRADGTPYYTMKYVRGRTLQHIVDMTPNLDDRLRLLPHFLDVCQATAFAHSRGVIHRDIKPGNVMVGEFGETLLIDWGLAKCLRESAKTERCEAPIVCESSGDTPLQTQVGRVFGTPAYMAPEQALYGASATDERADVYCLGAMLYAILTGRAPIEQEVTLDEEAYKSIQAPESITPGIPRPLRAICRKAMIPAREERYQSAREMAEDMEAYLAGGEVVAYRYGVWERVQRVLARHRAVAVTLAVSAILLLLLGVGSYAAVLYQRDIAVAEREEAFEAHRIANMQKERALRGAYYVRVKLAESNLDELKGRRARNLLEEAPVQYRGWEWGHIAYRTRLDRQTLKSASGMTSTGLAVEPEGTAILSTDFTGAYRYWDLRTGETVYEGDLGGVPIRIITSRPADGRVAFGCGDGTIRVFEHVTGRMETSFDAHSGPPTIMKFSPDGSRLASGGWDRTVRLWDCETWELLHEFRGHEGALRGVCFVEEDRLLTSANDGQVILWDIHAEQPVYIRHYGEVRLRDIVPVFHLGLFAVPAGDSILLCSVESGELVRQLGGHQGQIEHITVRPDGRQIATVSDDGSARLWNPQTGEAEAVLVGHEAALKKVAYISRGECLVTASVDGVHKVWDVLAASLPFTASPARAGITALADAPPRNTLLVGAADGRVMCWSTASGECEGEFKAHNGATRAIAVHPSGHMFATTGFDGYINVWDLKSRERVGHFMSEVDWAHSLCYGHDGERLAVLGRDSPARLVSSRDGTLLQEFPEATAIDLCHRSPVALVGAADGSLTLHNYETDKVMWRETLAEEPIAQVALDCVGLWLAAGTANGRIVLSLVDGTVVGRMKQSESAVTSLAFSPDSSRLVVGTADGMVRLWSTLDGVETLSLKRDPTLPCDIVFCSDNLTIVGGTMEKGLSFWPALPWRNTTLSPDALRAAYPDLWATAMVKEMAAMSQDGPPVYSETIRVSRTNLVKMLQRVVARLSELGYLHAAVRGGVLRPDVPGLEFLLKRGFERQDVVGVIDGEEFSSLLPLVSAIEQFTQHERDAVSFVLRRGQGEIALRYMAVDR